jgi:hypothetical protein
MSIPTASSSSSAHAPSPAGAPEIGPSAADLRAVVELRIAGRPGPTFALDPAVENVLGRSTDAVVALPDRLASRSHASIRRDSEQGRWVIRDLGSRNGTWLDGNRIASGLLDDGSVIRLGTSELVFRFDAALDDGAALAAGRFVRCGPVGQFAGRALRHPAAGHPDDSRWPLLLYQAGIRLLVSRSLREVIGTTLELAAEHCGATAYGWFRPTGPGAAAPRLEAVCIVPPGSGLFDHVGDATARMILDERKAVWIAAGGVAGGGTAGGGDGGGVSGDVICVPLVDHDQVIAMLAAAGPAGTLRDADFDFLVALASLAAAASAGRDTATGAGGPSRPVDESDDSSLREAISLLATIPIDALREASDDAVPGGGTFVLDAAAAAALDPRSGAAARISAMVAETATLRLDEWHRVLVIEALRRSGGSVPNAAAELGISRATLYRKLESYGLARSRG